MADFEELRVSVAGRRGGVGGKRRPRGGGGGRGGGSKRGGGAGACGRLAEPHPPALRREGRTDGGDGGRDGAGPGPPHTWRAGPRGPRGLTRPGSGARPRRGGDPGACVPAVHGGGWGGVRGGRPPWGT